MCMRLRRLCKIDDRRTLFESDRLVWFPLVVLLSVVVVGSTTFAQPTPKVQEQVLYSFQGNSDGAQPVGSVVFDAAGNLYGTTTEGGAPTCNSIAQCGTVYQLSPPAVQGKPWTETVLYVFKGNAQGDGASPAGGLVIDKDGNLYGTTAYGGTGNCVLLGKLDGCGAVFEVSPPAQPGGSWTETVLYSFPDAAHGYLPRGDLVFDNAGNLYGATEFGGGAGSGAICDAFYAYCGAIFELSPPQQPGGAWTEQVLHGFAGAEAYSTPDDGSNPTGGLILDEAGNLYGTTYRGGFLGGGCSGDAGLGRGCGIVFELHSPAAENGEWGKWKEEVLYEFKGVETGSPMAGVTFGKDGNLYGSALGASGGAIFELRRPSGDSSLSWTERIVHSFDSGNGADLPEGPVTFDSNGNLYGTAYEGSYGLLRGVVFRMSPPLDRQGKWTYNVIHVFDGPDGENPAAPLVWDKVGNLYSVTGFGGTGTCSFTGCGTAFELSSEQ